MNSLADKKFLIVGLGLIGGSYAIALKEKGYFVGGIDKDSNTIKYALENKIIEQSVSLTDEEVLKSYDVVVLALYPKAVTLWIEENQKFLKDGAIITDVTGIKSSIVNSVQDMLRPSLEFIGAHPMAGKESSGIKNASSDIFNGANFIITPTEKNSQQVVEFIKELAKELGFGRISLLSPKKHDEMIGFLSQLTHCIAVSLMNCNKNEDLALYTGDSFRDLTRIAKINEEMWTELFLMNKTELLKEMDLFMEKFKMLKKGIESDDELVIKEMMRTSTERRKDFDKK